METNYQLFDLKLNLTSDNLNYYTEIRSPSGKVLGYLSYTPHLPSKDIHPLITLVMLLAAFVVLSVITILLKRERKSRAEYEDKLFLEATTDYLTKVNNRRYFMEIGGAIVKSGV